MKNRANKDFQALKSQCILLEGDFKDMTQKIKTMEDRVSGTQNREVAQDIENKISGTRLMHEENQEMREKLEFLKKKIEINEQLKNIDLEELKLIAKSNIVMNNNINDLISKWEFLQEKKPSR